MQDKKKVLFEKSSMIMLLLFWLVIGIIVLTHKMNMYVIKNDYSFKLIGNEEITVLEGEEYVEQGVRILSREGNNLSDYVNINNNVNINKIGTYIVKYNSKYNNIRKKITRKVKVVEKENINRWIKIPSYDGSNEVTHPKVLYFEEGYSGYKYWMVNTPYPSNDAYYENPSIVVSNNGIDWVEPKGIKNPVSGYPNKERDDSYYSDPFILYDSNKFEIFFRKTKSYLNGYYKRNGYNYIYYINSNDGIKYSEPKIIMKNNSNEQYMSMSVVKRDNVYKIWYVNYDGKIRYIESKDLLEFAEPINVNINNFDKKIWHKEIQYVDNKYVCIFMIKYKLFYTESVDGINFSEPKEIDTKLKNIDSNIYNIYKTSFVITDKYIELFIPYRINYKWKMKYIKISKNDFYENMLQ